MFSSKGLTRAGVAGTLGVDGPPEQGPAVSVVAFDVVAVVERMRAARAPKGPGLVRSAPAPMVAEQLTLRGVG